MSLMNNSSREETRIEIRTSVLKDDRPILHPSDKLQYEVKEFHRKVSLGYYITMSELSASRLIFLCDDNTLNTALHIAAKAGYIYMIKQLLSTYADFNNPKIVNAWLGYRGVVSRDSPYSLDDLIEFVLRKNKEGNTMLHEAMMCNKEHIGDKVWEALEAYDDLGRGSNGKTLAESCYTDAPIVTNHEEKTVLYLAVEAGYEEAVKKMLDKAIIAKPMGLSPIVLAIMNRDEATLRMILEKRPYWPYFYDQEKRMPIHYAASIGHYEGVILLLDYYDGCQFLKDQYGYLPIHLASHGGHCKVVRELWKRFLKRSPSLYDNKHTMLHNLQGNILHIAANNGQHEVVRYILQTDEFQDMINEKDDNGNTPLHLAVRSCHPKTVHYLTWDSRVSLNLVNKKYQTPLDIVTEIYQRQGNSFMTEANALYQVEEGTSSIRQQLTLTALKSAGAKASYRRLPTSKETSLNDHHGSNTKEYSSRLDTLTVVSTLIITASVAACLAVPGEAQGQAYNSHQAMFHIFITCITISLFSSIIATISLFWARLGLTNLVIFSLKIVMPLLGIALVSLSLAFMAGIYTVINKLTLLANLFLVISVILVIVVVFFYMLLFFPSSSTNIIMRYISYYPFVFIASLVEPKSRQDF